MARRVGEGVQGEWGTALAFAVSGAIHASWMARLPAIREQLDTSLAKLGLAFFALGAGTLIGMVLGGKACRRFGSRRIFAAGSGGASVALVGVGLSTEPQHLAAVLLVFGVGAGAWDVAMNVQGSRLERFTGRHLLTRFHGWWSAGSVAGAALAVVLSRWDVPVPVHLVVVACICLALCVVARRSFMDGPAIGKQQEQGLSRRTRNRLVLIGALILCGAAVEGAGADWLAIYLAEQHDVTDAGAAAGYAIFVVAMAAGRLASERPHHHIGPVAMVRLGAVVTAVGVVMAVQANAIEFAYLGALCWGMGICVVFPAAVSAGGRAASAKGVAAMTVVGYSASLVAPPLIGEFAHRVGLGSALLTLPFLAAAVVVLAGALDGDAGQRAPVG